MRIEAALVAFWRRDATVGALTGRGKQIYRGRAVQDGGTELQRLHYEVQTDTNDQSLSGGACASSQVVVKVYCVGRGSVGGYEKARALADAVGSATGGATGGPALKSFRGWMPPGAASGNRVWVQSVRLDETEADEEEQPVGGGNKDLYVVALSLTVSYLAQ